MTDELTALVLNCTLKPSPAESSTDQLAGLVVAQLSTHGVSGDSVRVVDHDLKPGVERDMGAGDEWPALLERVLAADVLVFATPTWLGQPSSVAQRVLERLDAELAQIDDAGRPSLFDRIAVPVVVGNEDGAHHIVGILAQALSDVGFTIPAQSGVYWNGEAMSGNDFKDLLQVPDPVDSTVKTAASNAAHLARLLREAPFPAV
ncbi:MAG TPA: NAD(P)H-dependent oxidoreductase [Candidatus Microbacterium pullistercoris]|nr:NAD(P)H-dependent oxidoreductase [Candidatus Microbacterium pullistercoris]